MWLVEGAIAATASSVMMSRSCLVPDQSGFLFGVFEHLVQNEREYLLKHLVSLEYV